VKKQYLDRTMRVAALLLFRMTFSYIEGGAVFRNHDKEKKKLSDLDLSIGRGDRKL